MKSHTPELTWIEKAYETPDPIALPTSACPDLDRLRAAAAAELSQQERREVLDHAVGCAYCTESWRLAIRLGARPTMPLWAHYLGILSRDLRFLIELPDRLWYWLKPRLSHVGGGWLVPSAVLSLMLCFAVLMPGYLPSGNDYDYSIERGGVAALRPLVADSDVLPRQRAVLRWTGPGGASYDVRVTTSDGEVLDSRRAMTATRHQIPAEKLRDLEPGAILYWYVSLHPPLGGGQEDGPRFRVRIK